MNRCPRSRIIGACLAATFLATHLAAWSAGPRSVAVDADGTAHIDGITLPPSSILAPESRAIVAKAAAASEHDRSARALANDAVALRKHLNDLAQPKIRQLRETYPVEIEDSTIDGIPVTIITPKGGIPAGTEKRLMINVPGGGFKRATRGGGIIESIPVAALGKLKVVTLQYRQAPEFRFPAASEDIAKVYKALLEGNKPANIGLFGASAGGGLVAEAIALFQKRGLPRPSVLGIYAAGAGVKYDEGDSGTFFALGTAGQGKSVAPGSTDGFVYFADVNLDDPAVSPAEDLSVLAGFPPTIFVTSTRDFAMSTAARSHRRLLRVGVDSQLVVFDGLTHGFMVNPDFPESHEAYAIAARFFTRHLGR